MATKFTTNVPTNQYKQFDSVAKQIYQTFDYLIEKLCARRNDLLARLTQLKMEYETNEKTRKAGKKEIELQMQQMNLRENINISIHQKAREVFNEGLEQLKIPTRLPYPLFQCPTIPNFNSLISEFWKVVECQIPNYFLKKEPILTAGQRGSCAYELNAVGLAIDEANKLIYIADWDNRRIQVVSYEGQFICRFGRETLDRPWGIAVTKEHVFVTDTGLKTLLQFQKNSYELIRRADTVGSSDEKLNSPNGLCIDYNGEVLVADSSSNRVSIFSKELQYICSIGIGQLKKPKDVKLTSDGVLVVLDSSPKCIHFYSHNGHFLKSCISLGVGIAPLVRNPFFFCLDPAGNIIISDYGDHAIKIVSQTEQLIHTIGREGEERGEFMYPHGICLTKSGTIIVISDNPNYSIQCF